MKDLSMMPVSLFLALKYLKPKRTYFSVVTIISILGVLLGVAVLIIVLSVMSGFDDMWREKILGFNAHLTVSAAGGVEDEGAVMDRLRSVPGVSGMAPTIESPVVIEHGGRIFTPVLRGVDREREGTVSQIPAHMVAGVFCPEGKGVVLGVDLARRMGVTVGDKLLINSPKNFVSRDEIALPEELVVAGVFEVGMWEYDMGFVLCSLEKGRELVGMEDGVQSIRLMTKDPYRAQEIRGEVRSALGTDFYIETWMEQNRQLFSALRVEKNMMFFLLIFITIVAAFGITNTLITVTVQKTKEIGLLKSIGFSSGTVMRIFFWQGWLEGMIGTSAGIGTAVVVLRYRNDLLRWLSDTFQLELLPKELYHLSEIPSRTSLVDVAIVAGSVVVICTVAGLIPAWRAARLDPVQALRHE
jgi:lipoprotein-releasing system permease protein